MSRIMHLGVTKGRLDELSSMRGRAVLITGAGGHLGRVIAETFADLGADLILVDKSISAMTEMKANLSSFSAVDVKVIQCDLSDERSRDDLIQQVKSSFTHLSCLVNNASFVGTDSVAGWAVPFESQSLSAWRESLEVGLTAPFHLCRSLVDELRRGSGANVLNISSIYGSLGPDWRLYEGASMASPAGYAATKGGLNQLTRWLSTTLAPAIRVNAIAPGGISRNQPEPFVQSYESRTPLKRMAVEDDFRGAVAFLGSDLSRYVTGEVVTVDGGWSAW
jgi:NAD(P)-dependent dehydrogenase (short-subunit alcohol dehydrogenase family)